MVTGGFDVGLMIKGGYQIGMMRSHINIVDADRRPIFSRDCPEYCVRKPQG